MKNLITMQFYGELNDLLPFERRNINFDYKISESGSVKDTIEALGIPHTEVDVILVNHQSVDFSYKLQAGDQVLIYPANAILDIEPVIRLQPAPLKHTRFILDTHLGRLAAYLRMLGFDTLYRNDYHDSTLSNVSVTESRILLTCDRQLLMRKAIQYGYYVRSRKPRKQLIEVVKHFNLSRSLHPFTRCMRCNGVIHRVDKALVQTHLQPRTRRYYDVFWQCPDCKKVYWEGSHYIRMQKLIEKIKLQSMKDYETKS